jgi:two-component system alkaline phosphatase synthesis response regulator PhoP
MASKRRLLCVDDHEDICELVATILEDSEVVSEHSKADGLRQASIEKFDLILLDYYLPDGTGLELCLLIRVFDLTTPVLLITSTREITQEQFQAVGGQGVIRKDRLTLMLREAVSRLLD